MSRSDPIRTSYYDAVSTADTASDWLFYIPKRHTTHLQRRPQAKLSLSLQAAPPICGGTICNSVIPPHGGRLPD